jgi:S-formylglutathione hydrolase FrmB
MCAATKSLCLANFAAAKLAFATKTTFFLPKLFALNLEIKPDLATHYAHFMDKRLNGKGVALAFMLLVQPLLLNPTPIQAAISGQILHLRIASPEIDYPVRDVYVWTPPLGKLKRSSLPVVYMLHGWPGSPSSMISAVVQPLTAAFTKGAKPFIAVFPDGNAKTHADSEWADSYDKKAMIETWITTKVIPVVELDRRRTKKERAIVGFSMGGYGAAIIGLHHPQLFSQIATLAGYFIPDDLTDAFGSTKKIAIQTPSNYLKIAKQTTWFLSEPKDDYTAVIRGQAARWAKKIKSAKAKYVLRPGSGGHSFIFVGKEMPVLAKWFKWPPRTLQIPVPY